MYPIAKMIEPSTSEEISGAEAVRHCSGQCETYDNAVEENFFRCLKCAMVYLRHFCTGAQAMESALAYIEFGQVSCRKLLPVTLYWARNRE